MKDKTYQSIVSALELLASGRPAKTNGKVNKANLIKEAGISKATLYRYFKEDSELREAFDGIDNNGTRESDAEPATLQQAHRLLKEEVDRLKSELSEVKRNAEHANKVKAHQIQLLWLENERLRSESLRLQNLCNLDSKIVPIR